METIEGPELYKTRNLLAAKFIKDDSFSHLLFIDSDMGFDPSLIEKFLSFNKPFVGALCPRRVEDNTNRKFVSENEVIESSLDNGFVKVHTLGTGILLLKREVFERISIKYPELYTNSDQYYYTNKGVTGKVHQCFAPMINSTNEYLSEDLSFCHRWKECNGEIWACIDERIVHVGTKEYEGRFLDRMKEIK